MKGWRLERRPREEALALWFLAICIPAAGGWAVQARYEGAIAAAQKRASSYYDRMLSNERVLQQAHRLRRLEHRARRDLQAFALGPHDAAATARFLNGVDREAARNGVRVTKIEPEAQSSPPAQHALASHAVGITVTGAFGRVLPFLADLTRGSSPLEIQDVRFAAAPQPSATGAPPVEARIHAVLYALPAEAGNAPARR